MLNEFSRTELLLGRDALDHLAGCRVIIFGVGGVGSYTAEGLVRSGIGKFVLVDNDRICLTNLNRQVHATHRTVGQYKVDVMAERMRDINPAADIQTVRAFYTTDNAARFFEESVRNCDYIVDAIDTVTAKIDLVIRAKEYGIPIISCMGAANKLDPTMLEVADIYQTSICPLAKVIRHELRQRGIKGLKVVYSREAPLIPRDSDGAESSEPAGTARRQIPGSVSFVPSVAGLIIAGEVVRDLTGIGKRIGRSG